MVSLFLSRECLPNARVVPSSTHYCLHPLPKFLVQVPLRDTVGPKFVENESPSTTPISDLKLIVLDVYLLPVAPNPYIYF